MVCSVMCHQACIQGITVVHQLEDMVCSVMCHQACIQGITVVHQLILVCVIKKPINIHHAKDDIKKYLFNVSQH